jgi:hypothetical protein
VIHTILTLIVTNQDGYTEHTCQGIANGDLEIDPIFLPPVSLGHCKVMGIFSTHNTERCAG